MLIIIFTLVLVLYLIQIGSYKLIDLKASLGGSTSTPINSIVEIRSTDTIIINGGSTYLRSGFIEDNVSTYPDATRSVGASLGVTYPVISTPTSICWDGTYHWVGSRESTIITQYDAAFTPTGLTKDIGILPRGLSWDGTNFWAVQSETATLTKLFRKYDASWVYSGLEVNISDKELLARGIASDGVHVHIIGTDTDSVWRWTVAGVFVDNFFSVASVTGTPSDILIVSGKFWVTSRYSKARGGIIAEFSATGVPTGRVFDPVGDSSAMNWDGTSFWTTRYDSTVWKYSGEFVGIPQREVSDGGDVYMRVA